MSRRNVVSAPSEDFPDDRDRLLLAFRPLARSLARRYAGRGAEFEDLEQEAYLAMMDLMPRCPVGRVLAAHLVRHLPGRVRRAAERLRRPLAPVWWGPDLDDLEELLPCPASGRIAERVEAADLLERMNEEDRGLALRLADGETQAEIAGSLGISQQALSARLRRMRARLNREWGE